MLDIPQDVDQPRSVVAVAPEYGFDVYVHGRQRHFGPDSDAVAGSAGAIRI
jgi:hypothetical protein